MVVSLISDSFFKSCSSWDGCRHPSYTDCCRTSNISQICTFKTNKLLWLETVFSTSNSSRELDTSSSLRTPTASSKGWCKDEAGTGGYNSSVSCNAPACIYYLIMCNLITCSLWQTFLITKMQILCREWTVEWHWAIRVNSKMNTKAQPGQLLHTDICNWFLWSNLSDEWWQVMMMALRNTSKATRIYRGGTINTNISSKKLIFGICVLLTDMSFWHLGLL